MPADASSPTLSVPRRHSAAFRPTRRPAHRRAYLAVAVLLLSLATIAVGSAGSADATVRAPVRTPSTVVTTGSRVVTAGGQATVVSVVTAGGRPLLFAPMTMQRYLSKGRWTTIARRTATADGLATVRMRPARTVRVRMVFPGNRRYAPSASGSIVVNVTIPGSAVVAEAARYRGRPYSWGGAGPYRFDCSGFTSYVYARFGTRLPHRAQAQYDALRHLPRGSQRPGDLIFFGTPRHIYHAALYAGYGYIWHAVGYGRGVARTPIWTRTYLVGRIR